MVYTHAIVGLGVAGILTLASIPKQFLATTVVIEPSAVGGALATSYGTVVANIPTSKILEAFRKIPNWTSFPLLDKYGAEECPLLADTIKQMRMSIADDLSRVIHRTKRMTGLQQHGTGWRIELDDELLEAQKVFLCTGTEPKTLDLPIPHIPLNIALNRESLAQYITPDEPIVVFGLSHSGTLILKNLKTIGCTKVVGLYKGSSPFRFARDGDTEGIKQESATIADEILANRWGTLTPELVSTDDFAKAYRRVTEAKVAIYAIGFEQPRVLYKTPSGEIRQCFFRPDTSDFAEVHNRWGIGIGFPGLYTAPNGKRYPDVGFGGFIEAIQRIPIA